MEGSCPNLPRHFLIVYMECHVLMMVVKKKKSTWAALRATVWWLAPTPNLACFTGVSIYFLVLCHYHVQLCVPLCPVSTLICVAVFRVTRPWPSAGDERNRRPCRPESLCRVSRVLLPLAFSRCMGYEGLGHNCLFSALRNDNVYLRSPLGAYSFAPAPVCSYHPHTASCDLLWP